jgi:hypothetical protein
MIEFNDFEKTQKNFLNGKLSQYMDAYIRQHKVWTPEQMLSDFNDKVQTQLENDDYLPDPKHAEHSTLESEHFLRIRLDAVKWLITENGKEFSLSRFTKKYVKNKPVADRKSPIVERIRFGLKWDEKQYYDINFGLKEQFRFKETSELENIKYSPWTVEHVNSELNEKYDCDIKECFDKLSTSFLEKEFINYWSKNFYSKSNPCLIPEVCGFRANFYYFTYKDNIYSKKTEILEEIISPVKPVNFRYDFLIANFKKQKIAFIELDGFEFHKTRQQQTIDSIKRNTASKNNVSLFTFTSKRIKEDIESVFSELESILT